MPRDDATEPSSAPEGDGDASPRPARSPMLSLLFLLAAALLLWRALRPLGGDVDGSVHERRFETMTTQAFVRLHPNPRMTVAPAQALDAAEAAVGRVVRAMDHRVPGSPLYQLNHAPPGTPVAVDPDTWTVVLSALRMHALSGGAFDPTIGPLKSLYPYPAADGSDLSAPASPSADGAEAPVAPKPWPKDDEIAAAREKVGAQHLRFERNGMRLAFDRPGMALDLSALAKGFAVDRAMEALMECGVEDAMVEIGGEVRLIGSVPLDPDAAPDAASQRIGAAPPTENAPDAPTPEANTENETEASRPRPPVPPMSSSPPVTGAGAGAAPEGRRLWRTAIGHPRRPGEILATLERGDCAVATSGDYFRFAMRDGRRHSHIIDPRDGRPVRGGIVGVTVITPGSCMLADATATALSVLGPREGERFLAERADDLFRAGLEVWWVVEDEDDEYRVERLLIPGPGIAAAGASANTPRPARIPMAR